MNLVGEHVNFTISIKDQTCHVEVTNLVCTLTFGKYMPTQWLVKILQPCRIISKFHCVYKRHGHTTFLIYSTGKVVCNGCNNYYQICRDVEELVRENSLDVIPSSPHVVNIILKVTLPFELNFSKILPKLIQLKSITVSYDDLFPPAIRIRHHTYKLGCLIYSKGKIIVTGSRHLSDAEAAIREVLSCLC
jgi:TATA-box binding protein (TBP) (component of TFIID and TFIIIB)